MNVMTLNDLPSSQILTGDRALGSDDPDRLGFEVIAERLATALVSHATDAGMVIGINGSWGSGKSSLLGLMELKLAKLKDSKRPTVVHFRPWLVGNRDALLTSFMASLSSAIAGVQYQRGDASASSILKAKEAAETARRYATYLSKAGDVFELAGEAWGPLKWIGKGVKALGAASKKSEQPTSLSKLKDKLTDELRGLGHRFLVTIDDVDRLEPAEMMEVLRLVRSVADFPNVIYVLCYDGEVLAEGVRNAGNITDGHAFLEKIVQLTVMVPSPEAFQLRQWFFKELSKFAQAKTEDELSRLKSVVDYEGGKQLKTPRAVTKALDSIRFLVTALGREAYDLADLVWIQLIKDGEPRLYRWIEEYSIEASIKSIGVGSISETAAARGLAALSKAVHEEYFHDLHYRHFFAEQLPGVETNFGEDGAAFAIFAKVGKSDRDTAILKRRLASPDHYRLYFALGEPLHAIKQVEFDAFWAGASAGIQQASDAFMELHRQPISDAMGKGDILLERLNGVPAESFVAEQATTILGALANCMDDAFRYRPFDRFGIFSIWDRAERIVPTLLNRSPDRRLAIVESVFTQGKALGWLTSLFRQDTFAQGRFGDRRRPESEWLFTAQELDVITATMLARYQRMTIDEVLNTPDTIGLLFAWRQGGDEDGPRQLVEAAVHTDEGLMDMLHRMANPVVSTRGSYEVLKRDHLEPFMDFDGAKARIEALAISAATPETRDAAGLILRAFQNGEGT